MARQIAMPRASHTGQADDDDGALLRPKKPRAARSSICAMPLTAGPGSEDPS